MQKIHSLLIANRGEIACRIMQTARNLGIRTIAVYSDADRSAPHVLAADEAIHIGGSAVGESYLVVDNIIDAAKRSGAEAIHPGYGFLSENASFAKAVQKAGIVFVGPPVNAIEVMGDKARSKRAMIDAGVPCIPGYQGEDQSDGTLIMEAEAIGFPLMVKAAAGGGGRGMRLVHSVDDLQNAIKLARSEAENAFGSGELIIEKALIRPRHVEIQVFGDAHGNIVHLGERDCSVQRRHQKVIEESPCPVMTEKLRAEMGEAAVQAARAVDYVGAGTVEFLLADDGAFYFLEMNTRLQVEHPVTELVTGLDLVELQIRAAEGAALTFNQDDVSISGHAIEVRLYAEDPEADFLPSTGPVDLFSVPEGPGVRVDTGIATKGDISPFYDPMVAKVIAHGSSREIARRRLVTALQSLALIGPKNNRDFLIDALSRPDFVEGKATTAFISENYGSAGFVPEPLSKTELAIAAFVQHMLVQKDAVSRAPRINSELMNWGSIGSLLSDYIYQIDDGSQISAQVLSSGSDNLICRVGDDELTMEMIAHSRSDAMISVDGQKQQIHFYSPDLQTVYLSTPNRAFGVTNLSGGAHELKEAEGSGTVLAPMHGRLLEIHVKAGQSVKKGQTLAVLEAMKMQHEILAGVDGTISKISVSANSQVSADDLILEIEPSEEMAR